MQSSLRGNVSTYRLNTDDIVKMTDSQIMPPSSSILAATIGVTFIGPRNMPQRTMPSFLCVNCSRIRVALEWLRANNPLYRDIIISSQRLHDLPTNGFPIEITDVARRTENINMLIEESTSYVPDDIPEDEGMSNLACYIPGVSSFVDFAPTVADDVECDEGKDDGEMENDTTERASISF